MTGLGLIEPEDYLHQTAGNKANTDENKKQSRSSHIKNLPREFNVLELLFEYDYKSNGCSCQEKIEHIF